MWLLGCWHVAVVGSVPSTVSLTVGLSRSTICVSTVAAGFGAGLAVLGSVVASSVVASSVVASSVVASSVVASSVGTAAFGSALFAALLVRLRAFVIGAAFCMSSS